MRTIFTRRVILSSLAGALTLAVICSALMSWAIGAPHTSTPAPTAHNSATAAGYQVVVAPPTGPHRAFHSASGGLIAVTSTTTTSTAAATTTAIDD